MNYLWNGTWHHKRPSVPKLWFKGGNENFLWDLRASQEVQSKVQISHTRKRKETRVHAGFGRSVYNLRPGGEPGALMRDPSSDTDFFSNGSVPCPVWKAQVRNNRVLRNPLAPSSLTTTCPGHDQQCLGPYQAYEDRKYKLYGNPLVVKQGCTGKGAKRLSQRGMIGSFPVNLAESTWS